MRTLFDSYDAFIVDMDGTLTRGASLLAGAADFLSAAHRAKKRVVVLTDNSTRSREDIARSLEVAGVSFDADHVVTSSYVIASELTRMLGASRVFLIGERALADDLRGFGHTIVESAPADAVVVGFTHRFGYTSLAEALPVLTSGAPLLATDEAPVYAAAASTMPGAGCIVGAFRGMGFAPCAVAGKPSGVAVDLALRIAETPRDRVAVIGDSLANDGGAARHLSLDFVLVLSGISSREDSCKCSHLPVCVLGTLGDIACGEIR